VLSDHKHNPLGRFDGLASLYAKHRPAYPEQAIDWIVERLPDAAGTVVDVGCGTGISARQLALRGPRVIGVEPNDSMRHEAENAPSAGSVVYAPGRAEETGLESRCADAVVAAQAFHWFDAALALREFHRLLRPGGWVTLLWNDPDQADPLTGEFWQLLRKMTPEPEVPAVPYHLSGQPLLNHPSFDQSSVRTTPNFQTLDEEGFLGRAFSASFAPREAGVADRFAERLRAIFNAHKQDSKVSLKYQTTAYQARRKD
jgi:SAM-dependent methyltransferase